VNCIGRIIAIASLAIVHSSCGTNSQENGASGANADFLPSHLAEEPTIKIHLWNGNRTESRRLYEVELLENILAATSHQFGTADLVIDNQNFSTAQGEGSVLDNGADLLITIAGNQKFDGHDKIALPEPIAKGILGYRLPIIRQASSEVFAQIEHPEQLKALSTGVPETWFDAQLFRINGYEVVERGTFDNLFPLLKSGEFDYATLGVNEVEVAFDNMAADLGGLEIESELMVYYPYPLIFYVNAENPALAKRIKIGIAALKSNGRFDEIFLKHHGDIIKRLDLKHRRLFELENPALPEYLQGFESGFLG